MDPHAVPRAGLIKYGFLVLLVVGGVLSGLFFSGVWQENPSDDPGQHEKTLGALAAPTTSTSRFPLTALDVKDTVEAPELAADSTGRVFLTWASKTGKAERTVFLARSLDAGRTFSAPKTIGAGGVFRSRSKSGKVGYERRASPHVALAGKDLQIAWSEAASDGSRLRLMLATSTDAGTTFAPARPVDQTHGANPTFTALAVGPRGELALAWLGGAASQQPFAAVRRAGAGAFEEERLVHAGQQGAGTCPCCPVAACFAPDGTLYVAFRNLADGYRDIAVSVLKPGQPNFEGPFPVMPPTWKFDGCPHDGPSLAVVGDQLHVVWMDGRSGSQRCYHARATLPGMKFVAEELHAIAAGAQGNAKLHVDACGRLHAVWEESAVAAPAGEGGKHQHGAPVPTPGAAGRAIQHALLGADGRFGPPRAVAPRAGAFQTRPTIATTSLGQIIVAWNELDEAGKAIVVTTVGGGEHVAQGERP